MQEIWKPIIGYENIYSVSNTGRIKMNEKRYNIGRGQILKSHKTTFGYYRIPLYKNKCQKLFYVHILVIEAFLGTKPKGKQCNHIDCNKANNHIDNLEYVTPSENMRHAITNNLINHSKGINRYNAKFRNEDIINIRKEHSERNKTITQIAKEHRVTIGCISRIINRSSWTHI